MPSITLNFPASAVAALATFFLSYLWYTPLFGRAWAREMSFKVDREPTGGELSRGLGLTLLGCFFMVLVLAHNIAVWAPQTWGRAALWTPWQETLNASFFTWLGFFVPVNLARVAWEKASWRLFAINAGYHFTSLLVAAGILSYWK